MRVRNEIEDRLEHSPRIGVLIASIAPATGGLMAFLPLVIIMVIFYLLLILPAQRRQKKTQAMLSALKTGDKVVTSRRALRHHRGLGRRHRATADRGTGQSKGCALGDRRRSIRHQRG